MKVITDSIGNYSPAYFKSKANVQSKPESAEAQKVISADEKKFFANLYPAQHEDVMNYQFYNAKGKVSGVLVGSNFDKRG